MYRERPEHEGEAVLRAGRCLTFTVSKFSFVAFVVIGLDVLSHYTRVAGLSLPLSLRFDITDYRVLIPILRDPAIVQLV